MASKIRRKSDNDGISMGKLGVCGIVVLLIGVGTAWAFGWLGGTDAEVAELQQMREQMFANQNTSDAERQAMRDQFRQRVESLSDSQRRALFAAGREQWEQRNEQRMDQFFTSTPIEQRKQLDEMINRMIERQKERNTRNAAGGNRLASSTNANGGQGGGGGDARGGDRGNRRTMTESQREERSKRRLDRNTPKQRAQRAAFRQKLEQRMQQRGINPDTMPDRGGRGRGMA